LPALGRPRFRRGRIYLCYPRRDRAAALFGARSGREALHHDRSAYPPDWGQGLGLRRRRRRKVETALMMRLIMTHLWLAG